MQKAVIIGYGKLGSHLYYALRKSSSTKVSGIVKTSRNKPAPMLINSSNLIFITAQDSKINDVVKKLNSNIFDLRKKIILHTSGSLTSEVLKPLEQKGAYTGSFHPVQTFESLAVKDEKRFSNIYIALEGSGKAINTGMKFAKELGARSIILDKEAKPLHHICCVIASNFMAALIGQIESLGKEIKKTAKDKKIQNNGFNNLSFFNIYKPLAEQTLNNISQKGAVKSLTGPFERNDLETISGHLESLPKDFLSLYIFMGIETVKLSLEKKSIKPSEAKKILNTFDKYLKNKQIH